MATCRMGREGRRLEGGRVLCKCVGLGMFEINMGMSNMFVSIWETGTSLVYGLVGRGFALYSIEHSRYGVSKTPLNMVVCVKDIAS